MYSFKSGYRRSSHERRFGITFKSINGNMHACGHDGHAAMMLAIYALNEIKDELAEL